jgi:hypothetical protein
MRVMLSKQSFVGAPMHPLRFDPIAIQNAWFPLQLVPDSIGAASGTIISTFPLARIGQLVAMPTGEDRTTVENSHAPSAAPCPTEQPSTSPAQRAIRPCQAHRVIHRLPVATIAATPVVEDQPVNFYPAKST